MLLRNTKYLQQYVLVQQVTLNIHNLFEHYCVLLCAVSAVDITLYSSKPIDKDR